MDSDLDSYEVDFLGAGCISSTNDCDDDYIMGGILTSPECEMDVDEYQYEVLTLKEIAEHEQQIVNEINNVLKLSPNVTRMLLSHFNWDKEKLLDQYFDGNPDEFFRCAHVVNPFKTQSNDNRSMLATSHLFEKCGICFKKYTSSDSMTGLGCGHRFCFKCWREYLTNKIVTEGLGNQISCAAHGCDILVDDGTVTKLVYDPCVRIKYQQLLTNSFVECNKLLRWCPSVNCTYIIKVGHVESRPIRCKCGHEFCFVCGENWHDPVKCFWLKKWIKKCNDDSETSTWIAANTKECPQCNITIEKNGGCNHMICKNQYCKYDFCWVCLGPWEPHGTSWYNCNRYDDDEAKAARDAQEKLRASMARYLHFYNRYTNHMQSMKFENKLYETIKTKIGAMQDICTTCIEVQFLNKAVNILCQCRQTLMYTYVFAYYLKRNNQSIIFEANQKDLESATEKLSEYLERDLSSEHLIDVKRKVQDKYNYCGKRRQVLLDHVNEGYDKDWWEYLD